jgi:transposase
MLKKITVVLTPDQEGRLLEMVTQGVASARTIRRAHTLLYAWEGFTDERIAELLHCSVGAVVNTRKAFRDRGLDAVYEKPRPGRERRLDGRAEAHLVALACSDPPDERKTWTMQLLADRLVTLGVVDSVSDETVRRVLKNRRSSRG